MGANRFNLSDATGVSGEKGGKEIEKPGRSRVRVVKAIFPSIGKKKTGQHISLMVEGSATWEKAS